MHKKNKGFSLVEVILVLGIVIVAVSVSLFAYNKVSKKSTIQQEIQFANLLKEKIQNTYSIAGDYKNIDTQEIIDQGLVPKNRILNGNIIGNFGTNPSVEINISEHSNNTNYFNIKYTNMTKKVCFDFAAATSKTFTAVSINGNGGSIYDDGPNMVKSTKETFNIQRAANLCDQDNSSIYLISE